MLYTELDFRSGFILRERQRVDKERLIASSFNAWQVLRYKVKDLPSWHKYLGQFGLYDEVPRTKEELEKEVEHAMGNVRKIVAQATGNNVGG